MPLCSRCTNNIISKEDVGFINHSTRNTSYYCKKCCKMLHLGENEGRGEKDQLEELTFIGTVFEEIPQKPSVPKIAEALGAEKVIENVVKNNDPIELLAVNTVKKPPLKEYNISGKSAAKIVADIKELTGEVITFNLKSKSSIVNKAKSILTSKGFKVIEERPISPEVIEMVASSVKNMKKGIVGGTFNPNDFPEELLKIDGMVGINKTTTAKTAESIKPKSYISLIGKTARELVDLVKKFWGIEIKTDLKSKKTIYRQAVKSFKENGYLIRELEK